MRFFLFSAVEFNFAAQIVGRVEGSKAQRATANGLRYNNLMRFEASCNNNNNDDFFKREFLFTRFRIESISSIEIPPTPPTTTSTII